MSVYIIVSESNLVGESPDIISIHTDEIVAIDTLKEYKTSKSIKRHYGIGYISKFGIRKVSIDTPYAFLNSIALKDDGL